MVMEAQEILSFLVFLKSNKTSFIFFSPGNLFQV